MIPPPRSTSLVATGRQGRSLAALTPVLLAFKVVGVDARRPQDLISGRVEVSAVVNPALDAVLIRNNGERLSEGRYRFPLKGGKAEELAAVLKALVPSALVLRSDLTKGSLEQHTRSRRPGSAARLRGALEGSALGCQALELSGIDLESKKGREKARGVLVSVDVRKDRLELAFHTALYGEGLALPAAATQRLGERSAAPALLDVTAALDMLEAAGERGLSTVDTSTGAGMGEVARMLQGTVLVTRAPGSPGLCQVLPGDIEGVQGGVVSAPEGLAVAARQHLDAGVAVDDQVVEIAEMALSAPIGREGLQVYQDLYCSVHLVSRHGVVNALAPGMGKTVCVLSAWREAASNRSEWWGLVTVPAGLRSQWKEEAGRFFPEAQVHVIAREADVEAALTGSGVRMVIVSHDGVARNLEALSSRTWDEVVCDEAVALRGESQRSRALWQLRKHARKAAALTGTPDERGAADLARLVAWVRDEDVPVGQDESLEEVVRRCGPTVFALQAKEISSELPQVAVQRSTLEDPGTQKATLAAELELSEALTRLQELQGAGRSKEAAQLRVQLTRLLGAVRSAASRGAKQEYALGLAARGKRVLAFTEFPDVAREILSGAAGKVRAGAILGGQTNLERTAAAAAFVQGELDILCVSGTGHRGLNLQVATDVVHLDLPMSAAALVQRTARAVRLGGRRGELQVHVPVLGGTADTRLGAAFEPVLRDLEQLTQEQRTTVDLYSADGMRWLLEH